MQKMLAPGLCTWPSENPELLGSRCSTCAAATFPVQARCPRCGERSMTELSLPSRGTLIAWTTQGFLPNSDYAGGMKAQDFVPFGVGLVQLGDIVRVEAKLTENDPAKLRNGMDVELNVIPFYTDAEGNEIMTFAFAPVDNGR